jgi:serine O-acetyltransferase
MAHAMECRNVPLLPALLRSWNLTLHGCDINPTARFGSGLSLPHPVGVVVGGEVHAGANCRLFQNVTLGSGSRKGPDGRSQPTMGDNVTVFAGAVVAGPLLVGDNAWIGANAVVMTNVPENAIVAGIPAKTVRLRSPSDETTKALAGYD